MNDTTITVVGNVVDEPRMRETGNGHKVVNFRVASTSRRFDREQQRFVDNATLYINVSVWRSLAENVYTSIRKGHPVVVTGRLTMHQYVVQEQPRTSYEIDATAVGHDLSRGTSLFERVYRNGGALTIATDEQGVPADDSDRWHGVPDPDPVAAGLAPSEDARELAAV